MRPLNPSLSNSSGLETSGRVCVCVCVSGWEGWRAGNSVPAHTGVFFLFLFYSSVHFSGAEKTFPHSGVFDFFRRLAFRATRGTLNWTLLTALVRKHWFGLTNTYSIYWWPRTGVPLSPAILGHERKPTRSLCRSSGVWASLNHLWVEMQDKFFM